MTALIIEDEIPAGKRLERLLVENNFVVLANINSVKNAIHWLSSNNHPDYIFMDIELTDGNCFSIFEKVKINTKVVFTTAYNQYALKAFECNAIDYLLKPIDKLKLEKMLGKVKSMEINFLLENDFLKNQHNISIKN